MRDRILKKKLSTASLIRIPITEEDEPCESHSICNCPYCKPVENYNPVSMLKRSISYNAIAGSKGLNTKAPVESMHHPLARSYSQTSICSATTAQSLTPYNDESFNEFIKSLFKKEDYNDMRQKWDEFPRDLKQVFIARTIASKHPDFLDSSVLGKTNWLKKNSPSVNEAFQQLNLPSPTKTPTNNSYMHYKDKLGPRFKDVFPTASAAKITKAVSITYNELPQRVKDELKLEAQEQYLDEMGKRFSTVSSFTTNHKDSLEPNFDGVINEKIDLDGLADMISKKISMKLELETPTKIEQNTQGVEDMKSLNNGKAKEQKVKTSTIGRFFKSLAKRTKHKKRAKKPASLNLYRTPTNSYKVGESVNEMFFSPNRDLNNPISASTKA